MTIELSANQRERLKPHIRSFLKYMKTDAFKDDQEIRARRVDYFQEELPQRLGDLSENDITDLVGHLWASGIWGSKQWLVQKVIEDNGLESLREELRRLLDKSQLAEDRYERALRTIKRLGPASITEILSYSDPEKVGIWNERSRGAIRKLRLETFISPEKYWLSAAEYAAFNSLLQAIGKELAAAGVPDVDLLLVDFFLYRLGEGEKVPLVTESFDHDETRDLIDSVGTMLGFDTQREVQIAHGAKVDVVWRARIGNLGLVTYVFEVHKAGSIDSLVLNLQKARSGSTVQKVIAVSDNQQLERIEKETEGLPEEFRRTLAFWPVSEVQKVGQNLRVAMESITALGLVPGT